MHGPPSSTICTSCWAILPLTQRQGNARSGNAGRGQGLGSQALGQAERAKWKILTFPPGITLNSPSSCPSWKGSGGAREGAPGAVTRGMGSLSRGETRNLLALEREGEAWLPSMPPPPAPQHPVVQRLAWPWARLLAGVLVPNSGQPLCLHCLPPWSSPRRSGLRNPEGELRLASCACFEPVLSLNRGSYAYMRCRMTLAAFSKSRYDSPCFSHVTCKRATSSLQNSIHPTDD